MSETGLDPTAAHQTREALVTACELYRKAKETENPPKALLSCVGRQWLNLALACKNADDGSYELTSPFHPPYYREGERNRITDAIRKNALQVDEDGMYTKHGQVITEFEWKNNSPS